MQVQFCGRKIQRFASFSIICSFTAPHEKEDNSFEAEEEELNPLITAWEASGRSRLTNEFEVIKSLGKGGFGDVLKVKLIQI